MDRNYRVGDLVTAEYKTGRYIGRIVELTSTRKAAVQIAAVVKHPEQGDLHNPMQADVAFFHQRRALAHNEVALMPLPTIEAYEGPVPDYRDSLRRALQHDKRELDNLRRWAERAFAELAQLEKEYFNE